MGGPLEIYVLGRKVRLYQPVDGFRTSLDSVLLAAACPASGAGRALDMGCGVGGAAFCLSWRVPALEIVGVDIQDAHVTLARDNAVLNAAADRTAFLCENIMTYDDPARFDHAICNPPFLDAGSYTPSPSRERALALGHHGTELTLNDWIDAGFRNLRSGGSLTMIHRADHAARIVQSLGRRFGAIELIPVYPRAGDDARRIIIRAIKDRRSPARISPGLILHETDGTYTAAADAILRDGAAIG